MVVEVRKRTRQTLFVTVAGFVLKEQFLCVLDEASQNALLSEKKKDLPTISCALEFETEESMWLLFSTEGHP